MTKIIVIDRPCGFGKSTDLISWLQNQSKHEKFLLVVPELSEVERFQLALGGNWFKTPTADPTMVNVDGASSKTDQLIKLLSVGSNVIITHALYTRIKRFEHLLGDYHVIVDEVPTVAEQVPATFGNGTFVHLLQNKKYISIDPITKLITATSNWLVDEYSYDEGSDVGITRFMETLQGADVYYVSGTYCLMPLPDAFFTRPKTLRILTFLFTGTQLEHYMKKRGYGFYLHIDPNELALFKQQMNANLNVYKSATNVKTGYEAITSKDATVRKKVGNFVKNLIQKLNKVGLEFNADKILIASSKDAWFGIEVNASSKVSNATSLKTLTRLGDATYTAMITRGTNKFKERDILIMMGKVNMHPDLAKFLGMGAKAARDRHTLSELVQLIYRTAIRDGKEIFFITADADNVRILRNFLRQ